jgi:hypothetical protein
MNMEASRERSEFSPSIAPTANENLLMAEALGTAIDSLERSMIHLSIFLNDEKTDYLWFDAKALKDKMVEAKERYEGMI